LRLCGQPRLHCALPRSASRRESRANWLSRPAHWPRCQISFVKN
jgi:hypothetical protein